ncbi:MAG: hypothetical protein JSW72_03805 [Candidatus Bathyarchaeota archaeon]|nr:MAG: hypothetical protein JSW72_03805 [Candidatus Bathyarchaeota archaeon]
MKLILIWWHYMKKGITCIKIGLIVALIIIAVSLLLTGISYAFVYESHLEVVSGPVLNPNTLIYSPPSDQVAEILDCGQGHPGDFPPSTAGKIALIQRGALYFSDMTQNAAAAGALAVIVYNNVPGNMKYGTLGFITDISAVIISDVEGALLLSLLASGPVTVHLRVGPYLAQATTDVLPGVWPNTINIASSGTFEVALCGTELFDVTMIDPTTVVLYDFLTDVPPTSWRFEDVATPYIGPVGSGHAAGADGLMDMVLDFDIPTVVAVKELADHVGETVGISVYGLTYDELRGGGYDYVQIVREEAPGIPEFNLPLIAVTSISAAIYLAFKKRMRKNLG